MFNIQKQVWVASILLGCVSTAFANTLTSEQKALLDAIKSDPEAARQALSILKSSAATDVSAQATAQPRQSKQKVGSASTNPPKKVPDSALASDEPDAITKLIQNNRGLAPADQQYSPCAGWHFFLRQDWKDLGGAAGAACPDDPDNAQGAQISFANDLQARNRIVTINGTAAVIYNSISGDVPAPRPYAVSFGAYTTVDDVSNSATSQASSNARTVAYGGLLNLGFLNSNGGNYFMLRGGVTEDFIKNTTASSTVLDWSPVYGPLYIHYPYNFSSIGIPIIARFDPDLVARYDGATGKNQLLAFNNLHDSLRLGPEFGLSLWPDIGRVSGVLARFSALFGYDIWYEAYSNKKLTWFSSSLVYNIDDAGNFGIKGTYNTGNDTMTGKLTNIYKIGLSGKM